MKLQKLLIIFVLLSGLHNPLYASAPEQQVSNQEHKEESFIKKHKKLSAAIAGISLVLIAGICFVATKSKKEKLQITLPSTPEPHLSEDEQDNRGTIHEYASTYAKDAGVINPQNRIRHERTLSYLKDKGLLFTVKDPNAWDKSKDTLSINNMLLESLTYEAQGSWLWNTPPSPQAQYDLGVYYYHTQDYSSAAYWFEKAVINNYIDAYPYLAELYLCKGNKGIFPPDKQTPIALLKHATFNKNNPQAKLLLAQVYIYGPDVFHHDKQDAPQNVEYGLFLLDEIIEDENIHETFIKEATHLRNYLDDGLNSVFPRPAEGKKEFNKILANSTINEQALKRESSNENSAQPSKVIEQQPQSSPQKQNPPSTVAERRKFFQKPKEELPQAPKERPSDASLNTSSKKQAEEQELVEASSDWRNSTNFSITPELQQQLNEEHNKTIQKRIKPCIPPQEQPPANIVKTRKAEIEQKQENKASSQPQNETKPEPLPFEVTWLP